MVEVYDIYILVMSDFTYVQGEGEKVAPDTLQTERPGTGMPPKLPLHIMDEGVYLKLCQPEPILLGLLIETLYISTIFLHKICIIFVSD